MMLLRCCCRSERETRHFFVAFILFVWHMIQQQQCTALGTAECCRSTSTTSSASRDRAHRPRLHRVRDSRLSRLPETGSAHLKTFAMTRAVSLHSSSLGFFLSCVPWYQLVRNCNEYFVCLMICERYLDLQTNWYVPV